jgi:hypothetical protein
LEANKEKMFSWNEEELGEGLRIVIIKNIFSIQEIPEEEQDQFFEELEEDIMMECLKLGEVTKLTVRFFGIIYNNKNFNLESILLKY